jgi:hypothetical protein
MPPTPLTSPKQFHLSSRVCLVCHRRMDGCETNGAESQEATAPEVESPRIENESQKEERVLKAERGSGPGSPRALALFPHIGGNVESCSAARGLGAGGPAVAPKPEKPIAIGDLG